MVQEHFFKSRIQNHDLKQLTAQKRSRNNAVTPFLPPLNEWDHSSVYGFWGQLRLFLTCALLEASNGTLLSFTVNLAALNQF